MKVTHADIHFNHNGTPFAPQFDDLYFSDAQGLEETQHVFLQHNQLPARWFNWSKPQFVIAETGFGTGLNFLVTLATYAHLCEQNTLGDFKLYFLSTEKFPLHKADLGRALEHYPQLGHLSQALLEQYPINVAGCHRLSFLQGKVILDLWLGDVHDILPQWAAGSEGIVDAWFLDGFAPSKNPDMWSPQLFAQMARLASADCTFATFTAAGMVKRGLQQAGFSVEKQPGHGKKRHNLSGSLLHKSPMRWPKPYFNRAPASHFSNQTAKRDKPQIAIIGGGLAAAQCAYALSQRGLPTRLYCQDNALAQGASGNHQGAIYPHLNAIASISGQFHALAYLYACRFYRALANNGANFAHQWCGVLQLAFNQKVSERYQKFVEHDVWSNDLVTWLDAAQTTEIANIELPYDALFFPHGGWVNPPQLVQSLIKLAQSEVHTNKKLLSLQQQATGWQLSFHDHSQTHADIVIIATGSDFANLAQLDALPLKRVRGQVENIESSAALAPLSSVICHKGYLTPALDNVHALGSTYIKDDPCTDYRLSEQTTNINLHKKSLALSPWAQDIEGQGRGRAAIRCGTADHLPMMGAVPDIASQQQQFHDLYKALTPSHYPEASDLNNLYMLNGLGSRGLTTSPLLAELLASQICGEPLPLSVDMLDKLNPNRFLVRGLIRRQWKAD